MPHQRFQRFHFNLDPSLFNDIGITIYADASKSLLLEYGLYIFPLSVKVYFNSLNDRGGLKNCKPLNVCLEVFFCK